jgi:ATP-dependent RNA helicase RhlB
LIKKLIKAIRGRLFDSERSKTADPFEKTGSPTPPVPSAARPGPEEKAFSRPKPKGTAENAQGCARYRSLLQKQAKRRRHLPSPGTRSLFQVPEEEGKIRFHDLGLPDAVMHAIADTGFKYCTPIQAEIMPSTLKGRDAFGRAQTGTGKTAAFLITVLTRMLANPTQRANGPLAPPGYLSSRRLANWCCRLPPKPICLSAYCHFSIVSVFGGMDYEKQRRQLHGKPVDIVVATPGAPAGFQAPQGFRLEPGGDADPRRSRPHARHGVYPRCAPDRLQHAA